MTPEGDIQVRLLPGHKDTWRVTLTSVDGRREPPFVHVARVAQHFRICVWHAGPALEGYERFATLEEAVESAAGYLRTMEAARMLGAKRFVPSGGV